MSSVVTLWSDFSWLRASSMSVKTEKNCSKLGTGLELAHKLPQLVITVSACKVCLSKKKKKNSNKIQKSNNFQSNSFHASELEHFHWTLQYVNSLRNLSRII